MFYSLLEAKIMIDEELRLECLKLAAPLHPYISGFGDYVATYQVNIPRFVQLDADK